MRLKIHPEPSHHHTRPTPTNQPNRWWGSLSVRDALRLDYKAFTANTAKAGAIKFGMSSVLVPVEGPSVRPMRL